MTSLTSAELAQMREAIEDLMPDSCDILQLTQTSDGAGGLVDTWGTATGGVSVPCRLDFGTPGNEAMSNSSLTPFQKGIVSMPYNYTVTHANRLKINSITYSVQGVNTNQSWIGVKRVIVERVP